MLPPTVTAGEHKGVRLRAALKIAAHYAFAGKGEGVHALAAQNIAVHARGDGYYVIPAQRIIVVIGAAAVETAVEPWPIVPARAH